MSDEPCTLFWNFRFDLQVRIGKRTDQLTTFLDPKDALDAIVGSRVSDLLRPNDEIAAAVTFYIMAMLVSPDGSNTVLSHVEFHGSRLDAMRRVGVAGRIDLRLI